MGGGHAALVADNLCKALWLCNRKSTLHVLEHVFEGPFVKGAPPEAVPTFVAAPRGLVAMQLACKVQYTGQKARGT